ncbi:MAG TPA: hypothetical protein VLU24_08175 [Mycobacterium sp.]|nr:hypothetical protein [Mycobacterium sp.]
MPDLQLTVRLEVDGAAAPGFPLVRRLTVPVLQPFNPVARGGVPEFKTLPVEEISNLQLLAVRPDRDVTLRVCGQTSSGIRVKAGGLALFFNSGMCQPPTRNALVRNEAATAAHVQGVGGGL